MHYFEFATKDTTLYEVSSSMNTGLDEILEIRKDTNPDGSVVNVSRALIKFDLSYISESISSGLITSGSKTKFHLNLYDANSNELHISQTLYGYPVSQSWDMGSGRAQANPLIEDGASWKYKDNNDTATPWFGSYTALQGNTYADGTLTINEGDYNNQEVTIGGFDFIFVAPTVGTFNNSSTQIFVASGSTTGSSTQNLTNAINNTDSSSLHGLSISASLYGNDNTPVVGNTYASGTIYFSQNPIGGMHGGVRDEISIDGVDFVFVSGSLGLQNTDNQIFVEYASGSVSYDQGMYTASMNLRDAINNSSSLHGLPISASVGVVGEGGIPKYLILSGSTSGTSANLTITTGSGGTENAFRSVVEMFGAETAFKIQGGTDTGGTGGVAHQLILSGSAAGTSANLTAASSSGLFVFSGGTSALAGGTDSTTTLSGGGGTWYSGSGYEASQSFTHEPSDLRMDVTDIVWKWLHSTVPNEGFMLKRSGSIGNQDANVEEGNNTKYGHFVFFGRDTHTIYQPKLEVVWDDSTWATGSLSALSNTEVEDMVLYMRGLRPEYKETSKTKFRVVGRARYPEKSYATSGYSTGYTTAKYLPSGSTYYQIKDAYTEDILVPFGTGSIVSCDSTGNYFNFWMNGLQSERFYRIEYKIVSGSGTANETVQYFDEKHSFKVVR
jgi:hypothetical protein